MNKFIAIHRDSNLIINVTAQVEKPADSATHRYIPANNKSLLQLLSMSSQSPTLWDIGDLMSRSAYIADQVGNGKVGKAQLMSTRIRDEVTPTPTDRESTIRHWISVNPDANHHDLSEVFHTGTVVAKSYISRYR